MTGYVFNFKEHGAHDPDGPVTMTSDQIAEHNKALSAAEVVYIRDQSPDKFVAYVTERGLKKYPAIATTWDGDELGRVTGHYTRKKWNGFAYVNMAYVTVRAINGATYYGCYGYDWNESVILRKSKR